MADTQIRYARTTDGVNIAYFTMGSGVPLVFVQLPMSNLQYDLSNPRIRADQEAFARNALLVRYDHRGIGVSDRWDAPFTTEGFVRDLEAVVDKLELRRFLLVALYHHAYPIALAYAALHPDRVISMAVMVGGTSSAFASSVLDIPDADWHFISDTIARRIVGTKDTDGAAAFAEELRQAVDLDGLRRVNEWGASATEDVHVEGVTTPCLFLPYSFDGRDWVAKARSLASRMENAAVRPLRALTWADGVPETNDAITSFFTRGRGVPDAAPDAPASEAATAMGGYGGDPVYGHRRFDGADGADGRRAVPRAVAGAGCGAAGGDSGGGWCGG